MIEIEVRLFGAFRKYQQKGNILRFQARDDIDVISLKRLLSEHLQSQYPGDAIEALVGESAIADDVRVLPENHVFDRNCTLQILPPVCGG